MAGYNIPTKAAQPKRGAAFYDLAKDQNVWIYTVKDRETYCVSSDHTFQDPDAMYDAKPSDLQELHKPRQQSIKTKPNTARQQEKANLNDFFDRIALKVPRSCMNCGKPLMAYNKFAKRAVCAHILPKAKFSSIATNEDNILYLGADLLGGCNCHDLWDRNGILNRTMMKVYDVAIQRFELLKPHLDQKELIEAYTYLNIKWQ